MQQDLEQQRPKRRAVPGTLRNRGPARNGANNGVTSRSHQIKNVVEKTGAGEGKASMRDVVQPT